MDASTKRPMHGSSPRKIFALSRLAESISRQIAHTFSGSYWITAEINKLNFYPQSGHCFPELVEKTQGKIIAQLRAFILNTRYSEFDKRFVAATGKPIGDGMQVLMRCKVSFHPVYGLSLNIIDLDSGYTMGEMARLRNEAIKKLKDEGLFGKNKGVYRSMLLKSLAVVSVETSKGWQDFRDTLEQSKYGNVVQADLYPALLQGDAAVMSIRNALKKIGASKKSYDAVCIIRGGGGETGLDCYDHYDLAAAVCHFPIPVLTGIGHAANQTLVELCAFNNLITPTALAGYIIDDFKNFEQRIERASKALFNAKRGLIKEEVLHLEAATLALFQLSNRFQERKEMQLQQKMRKFENAVKGSLTSHEAKVKYLLPAHFAEAIRKAIYQQDKTLEAAKERLKSRTMTRVQKSQTAMQLLSEKIRLLDPNELLRRGYSITLYNGKAMTDIRILKPGDELETRLQQGSILSTVSRIDP